LRSNTLRQLTIRVGIASENAQSRRFPGILPPTKWSVDSDLRCFLNLPWAR